MSFSPTFSFLQFLTLDAGSISQSGTSGTGYTYNADGRGSNCNFSIPLGQEGGFSCKVNSGPAVYIGLSTSNAAQDETSWNYGLQWYAGTYYVIDAGSTLGAPWVLGQQMTAAVDDIRLRVVGDTSGVSEVVVEVLPAGGTWGTGGAFGDEVVIYVFPTKVTATLYPKYRSYVGTESAGPFIAQLGQAQARLTTNSAHIQVEGDSLRTLPVGYLKGMAPFLGSGCTWSDLSVAGSQWNLTGSLGMQNRLTAFNADWDSGRSNMAIAGAGSNDNAVNGKSNATIITDATAWRTGLTHSYTLGTHLLGTLPRAGSYANQTARDTGNGTGTSGLKGLNTSFQSSVVSMGFSNFIDLRPTGAETDFSAYLQTNFDNAGIWYGNPSFQEAWSGSIHPGDYLAYKEAQRISVSAVSYLTPAGIALTAVTATGSVGTVLSTRNKAASGNSATGTPGTVVPARAVADTGVSATSSVGTVAQSRTIAITGVPATGSVGTLAPTKSVPLTGASSTSSVGTVSAGGNVTLGLTAVSASGAPGTLAPARTLAATGSTATASLGAVVCTTAPALVGAQATATITAPGVASSIGLTADVATGSVGAVSVPAGSGATLAGVSAAASVGAVQPVVSLAVPGVSAVGSVGTVTASLGIVVALSGVQAVTQVRSPGLARLNSLAALLATGSVGFLSATGVPVVNGSATGNSSGNKLGRPPQISNLSRRGASTLRRN